MVRLKSTKSKILKSTLSDFNSTMVRLKLFRKKRGYNKYFLFQFHYGSIKMAALAFNAPQQNYFNSTMVRLKFQENDTKRNTLQYFNSTMVRLKFPANKTTDVNFDDFNSTMVRLKFCKERGVCAKCHNFNSTMVRLK